MAQISSGRGGQLAGRNKGTDGGAMAGARRSFARKCFRPRFSTGVTQGDRGEVNELT
jgi:hypothetical protein